MSFTHIATKSKPKNFKFLASTAILSLVPTPSVLLNKIGSLYFNLPKSKIEAKPPGFSMTSFLLLFFVIDSNFLTNNDVFCVSTPADL